MHSKSAEEEESPNPPILRRISLADFIRNALVQTRLAACAIGQVFSRLFVLFGFWTLRHVLDLECFDGDQSEAVDDLSGRLVNEIREGNPP